MALLSLVGLAVLTVTCTAVGARLLYRAFRTRQVPEFAIGTSMLLTGGVGYLLVVVGRLVLAQTPALGIVLYAAGILCINLGVTCLAYFVWSAFRPGWVGASLFGVLAGAAAVGYVGFALEHEFADARSQGFWSWLSALARMGVFLWAAAESFWTLSQLERRPGVDPRVRRRLLMWACSSVCSCGIFLVALVDLYLGTQEVGAPSVALPIAGLGLMTALFLWYAFYGDGGEAGIPLGSAAGGRTPAA